MVQQGSRLRVTDNSSAREPLVIRVSGGTKRKYAAIGDIVACPVKSAQPGDTVKKGDVVRAVIVKTTKPLRGANGSYTRFDDNTAVIIKDDKNPAGIRTFGSATHELRANNFMRIVSLAPEVL